MVLIPTWAERVPSFQVVKSVSLFKLIVCNSVLTLVIAERVAIARALLRNPKVLLLDEA